MSQINTIGPRIRDLAVLLSHPGRPVSTLDLVEAAGGPPTAAAGGALGPALDTRARQAYQARLADLAGELATAEQAADLARAERLRAEQAALTAQLGDALGLAGRTRTLGDPADRARKAVTMRIRAVLRTLEAADPVVDGDQSLDRVCEELLRSGAAVAARLRQPGPGWPVCGRSRIVLTTSMP